MPVANEKDDLKNQMKYAIESKTDGPELWQVLKFLNENKDKLEIKQAYKMGSQKEVSMNYIGQEETLEFEMIMQSDGSIVKGNYTVLPSDKPDKGKGGKWTLDLGHVSDPKKAEEILRKFHNTIILHYLKFHPANKDLTLFSNNGGSWKELDDKLMVKQMQDHADEFRNKGINVYINGKLIVGPKPSLEDEQTLTPEPQKRQKAKPWDVPRPPNEPPELKRK